MCCYLTRLHSSLLALFAFLRVVSTVSFLDVTRKDSQDVENLAAVGK
jgi:hypothetical protein